MQAPTTNRITQTAHLASKAVDHSASPDPYVYAPENGRINSYQRRGSGTSDAGNVLRLAGATGMHSFCHLSKSLVTVGQTVTQGQKIAVMGYTGYTIPSGAAGAHLHYYVLTPNGYVYPPSLYKSAPSAGGTSVFNNEAEVQEAYLLLRGVKATAAEAKAWVGQPKQRFFVVGKPEADAGRAERDALRKQLAEVKTALANEQAKPPKEVVRVVEKIVTKEVPVEVIKTVPAEVDEKQVVSNVLLRFWNSLFKKG